MILFLGVVDPLSRAEEGENSEGLAVKRMKDDPRRKGLALALELIGPVSSCVSTVVVRTIGAGIEVTRETGRMITSSPSKVRPEFREFNSVSGLTVSELTMTG